MSHAVTIDNGRETEGLGEVPETIAELVCGFLRVLGEKVEIPSRGGPPPPAPPKR